MQISNDETRHRAQLAVSNWFASHEGKLDIYDQMVKVRKKWLKKIGYDNDVQMGYDRLVVLTTMRCKGYRDQV